MQYMEKLDRMAEAEHGALDSKIADDLIDDEIEAAARAGVEAYELEQPYGEDGEFNPKVCFQHLFENILLLLCMFCWRFCSFGWLFYPCIHLVTGVRSIATFG